MRVQSEEQIRHAIRLLERYGSYSNIRRASVRREDGVSYIVKSPEQVREECARLAEERRRAVKTAAE